MSYTIYTDGGCLENPGGPGGCGIVIVNNDTHEEQQYSYAYEASTNNRMEMLAVCHAMEHLPKNPGHITLYSDSKYVLNTLKGEWSKNKNKDLWAKLDKLLEGKDIEYVWVKGHNGHRYNELCDQLATQGIHATQKLKDIGYGSKKPDTPKAENKPRPATNVSAMSVTIDIPGIYQKHADISVRTETYAKNMQVNPACANSIISFYRNGRATFQSYISLKSGGLDTWSALKKPELIHEFGQDVWDCTYRILQDNKDTEAAIRWYGRGLALSDSIRKVLVDRELRNKQTFNKI